MASTAAAVSTDELREAFDKVPKLRFRALAGKQGGFKERIGIVMWERKVATRAPLRV